MRSLVCSYSKELERVYRRVTISPQRPSVAPAITNHAALWRRQLNMTVQNLNRSEKSRVRIPLTLVTRPKFVAFTTDPRPL